ncbi:hypothetical protein Acel_0914 [Acidothermus cellulolyticus 11B]|uniref:Uncharacterized protein n=1 Tax=Acidothermus cellulolyticus (strain ATCC 43068 / DSM 8971 / 11B) TaxID=351607 RepID=A0LTC7_ACIC1|nr:hypothetical protein [Acidothermus cellulolyticus]ABK52687.1 hypothetical protein Acel_0914 [Acidothermus cellulolyticus 11B]MCL6551025.1 hypothetical protein [Acidothermus cellulolyticus]
MADAAATPLFLAVLRFAAAVVPRVVFVAAGRRDAVPAARVVVFFAGRDAAALRLRVALATAAAPRVAATRFVAVLRAVAVFPADDAVRVVAVRFVAALVDFVADVRVGVLRAAFFAAAAPARTGTHASSATWSGRMAGHFRSTMTPNRRGCEEPCRVGFRLFSDARAANWSAMMNRTHHTAICS